MNPHPPPANPPPQSSSAALAGFTLIELLTVIAIIGILAAIIIPTVGAVRAGARATNCASNMRQVGMAMQLYAEEHKGLFPVILSEAAPTPDTENKTWQEKIAPYVGLTNVVGKPGTDGKPLAAGVMLCPAFTYDTNAPKAPYAMNVYIRPAANAGWNYRVNISTPSRVFLLLEIDANAQQFSPNSGTVTRRHPGDSANFLFADAHVERIKGQVPATDERWKPVL